MYVYNVKIEEKEQYTRIKDTDFFYIADKEKMSIYKIKTHFDELPIDHTPTPIGTFKGNYIGILCSFRIDNKNRFKFMGEAKAPALKLLCEHGFIEDKRKMNYDGMPVIIMEDDSQKVIFGCNPENGEWWIQEDYLDLVMTSLLLAQVNNVVPNSK